MANETMFKLGLRVFALPYQFPDSVDPRYTDLSKTVGRSYLRNIRMEAPILTMIPGTPYYLPGKSKSEQAAMGKYIAEAANGFENLTKSSLVVDALTKDSGDTLRYYDFTPAYSDYIQYVNIMCRTIATFLELEETINGVSLQQFNWRYWCDNEVGSASMTDSSARSSMKTTNQSIFSSNYGWKEEEHTRRVKDKKTRKWKTEKYTVTVKSKDSLGDHSFLYQTTEDGTVTVDKSGKAEVNLKSADDESSTSPLEALYDTLTNMQYVRFCVDPSSGFTESYSNETGTSMLKSEFDNGSDMLKEVAFLVNSGGTEDIGDSLTTLANAATDSISQSLNGNNVTSILSRILNLTGNVVKGENVIMPDIYKSSSRPTTYSFTVHLKAPYGSKFGLYMDNLVPLMHLICLAIPKQATANTYSSPFLVKAFMDGVCNINLGMITDMQINKSVSEQSWTVDGMPNEIDVSFTIADLYSDLSMSPQQNPILFLQNTSLIEYLANTCGMSLVYPQIGTKINLAMNLIKDRMTDIPQTVMGLFQEQFAYAMREIEGF